MFHILSANFNLQYWNVLNWFLCRGISETQKRQSSVIPIFNEGIAEEIEKIQTQCEDIAAKISGLSEGQIGLEILQTFISDVLGRYTIPAKIFRMKVDIDFQSNFVVTQWFRYLCWFCLVAMNIFFIFYSVLKCSLRDWNFQYSYVISCIIQFAVEVFRYFHSCYEP